MKAPAVDYVRPRNLAEAVDRLVAAKGEARVIAGGQSLVALMNLRLASPGLLIDIARLPELTGAKDETDAVTLGACVTHAAIEDGRVPDASRGLMPRVAATLSHRAIRNRGTIGGSLALAGPAADWPMVLAALDAEAAACGPSGRRVMKCSDFVTGPYETQLAPDEILESVRIPKLSTEAFWGYEKLIRPSASFADALAVAVVDRGRGFARVVLGGANGGPLVLDGASQLASEGGRGDLRSTVTADLDRAADRQLDEFQRNLLTVAAMRAMRQALQ